MKRILITILAFSLALNLGVANVYADVSTAPVVSIGVGNGNNPENTGPVSGNTYNGEIKVYATVTDTNLDNYHFRVIKVGDIDGYTCEGENSLFLENNQGYASTTLSKTACGFVFNQSVYTMPEGFTNTLIATLNTADIIAFSGEGEYWFILGAVDLAGNRTNSNYLNDSMVKVVVSATPVAPVTPIPTPTPASSAGGASNGPVVGSYGSVSSGYSPASVVSPQTFVIPAINTSSETEVTTNTDNSSFQLLADGGIPYNETLEMGDETSIGTTSEETASSSQVAQAVSAGFSSNWLWLVLLALVLGGVYYYYTKKD